MSFYWVLLKEVKGSYTASFKGRNCNRDSTWRFMGSCKWGYESPNMGYKYSNSYPTCNPTYNYP